VDCCLGSFIVPYLEKAGFPTVPFDFRVKGVTSISCDTHKYGFAPKGSSVIMYRSKELRAYQFFVLPDWSGGVYASPTLAGSRPGALLAGCWATMMKEGESGYIESCRSIVSAAKRIEQGIRETIPELYIIGKPMSSVVAFSSNEINIYELADAVSSLGWGLSALQNPPAIHIACTVPTVNSVEVLLSDLRELVLKLKTEGKGAAHKGDAIAIYGAGGPAQLPNKSVVVSLAHGFLDTLYKA